MTGGTAGAVPSLVPDEAFRLPPVRPRDLFLGSGPRLVRDATGPMIAFYVGWRLGGLTVGVAIATTVALGALVHERRHGRSGWLARLQLCLVLVQAAIGLITGSEHLYLAQPVVVNAAWAFAFLGSVAIGRPLIGLFANEMYPFPEEVRRSETYRKVFVRISLVWGTYLLARSGLRLAMLATASVEAFILVNVATGLPVTSVLLGWSMWYGIRAFRRSEEWGEAIRVLDELQTAPASGTTA